NCVVPAGACEFRFTGQCDFNGGRGTVAVFHTCHNENWNGIHPDIITGNNLGEGVAGGSYNEGITNRNFRRAIERGEAGNVGHNKPWLVERANFFAGHGDGGGGDGFLSIVSQKPYNKRPPDAGPREICVSAVACDERLKRGSIYATDDAEEKKIVPESSAQLRPDLFRRDLWRRGDATLLPPRGDAAPRAFSTPSLFGGAAAVATPLRLAAPALGASASVLSAPAATSGFSGTPAAVALGAFGAAPAPQFGAAAPPTPFGFGGYGAAPAPHLGAAAPSVSAAPRSHDDALLENNDAALEDGAVPTQAPAMLALRQPSELSARTGRKSPCMPGRENQQKNKWPQEGRVVKILPCARPRYGYVVWHKPYWRVSDSDGALLTQPQTDRVPIKKKRKLDETGPACRCGNQPTRKRRISKVDSLNMGRFFWGCKDWTSEGNGCNFFQLI
ncbi:hypothetical protein M885DRAFT_574479, partial [Pelagophyceae sp. CCMP2097]